MNALALELHTFPCGRNLLKELVLHIFSHLKKQTHIVEVRRPSKPRFITVYRSLTFPFLLRRPRAVPHPLLQQHACSTRQPWTHPTP
jgi:hypothetical protein